MFQFPAFAFNPYVFRIKYPINDHYKPEVGTRFRKIHPDIAFIVIKGGFPHSDIHGSKFVRNSPWLFAAYHVLHRLCMPRHPPDALKTLDHSHCRCPFPCLKGVKYQNSVLDMDIVKQCYFLTTQNSFGKKTAGYMCRRKTSFTRYYPAGCG